MNGRAKSPMILSFLSLALQTLGVLVIATTMSACSAGNAGPDATGDTVGDLPDAYTDTTEPDGIDDARDAMVTDADGMADTDTGPIECSMRVGAAKRDITPLVEPFTDSNGNDWRDDDEPFTDMDDDDTYDPTYIAGFGARQATGVHDPIWTRCLAIESTGQAHLFCASDLIGLGLSHYDRVVARIRELRPEHNIAHENFQWATTHTHQGPDTQGVWDLMPLEYLDFIDEQTAAAAVEALDNLEPGGVRVVATDATADLIQDIDPPVVKDATITILQGVKDGGEVAGTLIGVANHPESGGPDNLLVSSDFPHFLRERVENAGGGIAIYFSGALGLMQTPVTDWENVSMEFAETIGNAYGDAIVAALENPPAPTCEFIWAAEIREPMVLENFDFYAGIIAGLINGFDTYLYNSPGECEYMGCVDVPVSAVRFGNLLTWINVPGEMVPELVTGEYPDPEPVAGEFADAAREPYLEQFVGTTYRFVAGLSDTEIGYIYPLYQDDRSNHEHQRNSSGPHVAASLMKGYSKVFDALAGMMPSAGE